MNSFVDQKANVKLDTLTSLQPMKFVTQYNGDVIKSINAIHVSLAAVLSTDCMQVMNDRVRLISKYSALQ